MLRPDTGFTTTKSKTPSRPCFAPAAAKARAASPQTEKGFSSVEHASSSPRSPRSGAASPVVEPSAPSSSRSLAPMSTVSSVHPGRTATSACSARAPAGSAAAKSETTPRIRAVAAAGPSCVLYQARKDTSRKPPRRAEARERRPAVSGASRRRVYASRSVTPTRPLPSHKVPSAHRGGACTRRHSTQKCAGPPRCAHWNGASATRCTQHRLSPSASAFAEKPTGASHPSARHLGARRNASRASESASSRARAAAASSSATLRGGACATGA
mmetsp:Transcript_4649/g.19798  ORF Transcript_4649/g.19798 Transcript_4649/m.19798 type:complete len:271 (+) Transcript_4649:2433-3245(+)